MLNYNNLLVLLKHKPDISLSCLKHSRGLPLFSRVLARWWPGLCMCCSLHLEYSLQLSHPLYLGTLLSHYFFRELSDPFMVTLRCNLTFPGMRTSWPGEPFHSMVAHEGTWVAHCMDNTVQALTHSRISTFMEPPVFQVNSQVQEWTRLPTTALSSQSLQRIKWVIRVIVGCAMRGNR